MELVMLNCLHILTFKMKKKIMLTMNFSNGLAYTQSGNT